ncbi:alpha/beta hydrolase [Guptibacillus algicola]|uniref:alpha/beta hydrolase n=1 Tax=Guptibacillus algicola TaxID=225844 RepID=UPI001CD2975B|nr:alpha/beta hydrolase [Alkalihalobacillus algicola]MCA0988291.1 alpha/beta hydrolase [Alkalihalobacillus algicola]
MKHIFKQGASDKPTLLLLHGTGGNEEDLVQLAHLIAPDNSFLSVRGNVSENGMPRFFKRHAEGVFDEEDLVARTHELNQFITDASEKYDFDRDNVIAIGYSNGANIAGSLLLHDENALKAAILHHPMVPIRGLKTPDLSNMPIFIGAGENDPICSSEETIELEKILSDAGASVTVHWERMGHQLTKPEVDAAAQWYNQKF